jgi:hypothetical protein
MDPKFFGGHIMKFLASFGSVHSSSPQTVGNLCGGNDTF